MYVLQTEHGHFISNSIDLFCYCAITELVMIRTSTSRTATRANKNSDDQNGSTQNGECRLGSHNVTSAVLRLECSLVCISGSVGHQQNIFRSFSQSAFLLKKKCNYKKCNWVSGSPSILYTLVLGRYPSYIQTFKRIC